MKRTLALLLAALLLLLPCASVPVSAGAPGTSARAAFLMEAGGAVLYEKNADERLPMASTTKIMTALVALDCLDPDALVTVPPEACGVEGSSVYLSPGEKLTARDLLAAVLLESANDAAAALAFAAAGGIEPFAELMNEKAAQLGLMSTHFVNPHGLDDEEHYTTARDLARLTAEALRNDLFRSLVGMKNAVIERDGSGPRALINHNRLLRMSGDVIGVKTGYTKRSGRCLVSAAQKDGVLLIAVTLSDPDDWDDHLALHAYGFSRCRRVILAEAGEIVLRVPCAGAPDGFVTASNPSALSLCLTDSPALTRVIEGERLLFAPVEKGTRIGVVTFYADGNPVASLPLLAAESIPAPEEKSFFGFFRRTRRTKSDYRNT